MKQIHGGDIYRNKNSLDFSSNINPYGPPKGVIDAGVEAMKEVAAYPDIFSEDLTKALGEYEGVEKSYILCGNGAADLIFRTVFAIKPKKALIQLPSFSEYAQALSCIDCQIEKYLSREEENFCIESDFLDFIKEDIDLVILCSPNNPTGLTIEKKLLEKIAEKCREFKCYLLLDECFLDFVKNGERKSLKNKIKDNPYLIILKAFTKVYSMAGIRLGYALSANRELLEKMQAMGQPWGVSLIAQKTGLAALSEKKFLKESVTLLQEEYEPLRASLKELGFQVFWGEANYVFFKGPAGLETVCKKEGILIRDCSNYEGLSEGFYRVAVKRKEDNERLIKTLKISMEKVEKKWQRQL
ncbi:MAG TPA: aminotransferase class I/II-fold pyridoxal phosphate-dependent enzyme [Lachnospiraceae bacterium]